ncbi:MAG: FxLYD domain-containing protein [Dehalococcoidales bacterium]
MSEKENPQEVNPVSPRQDEEDLDAILADLNEFSGEGVPTPEKLAEMARKAPDPTVTGNEKVEFVSHSLILKKENKPGFGKGVNFAVKNISEDVIGKLALDIVFFDAKGNVIDEIERSINDFEAGNTYTVRALTAKAENIDVISYDVHVKETVITPAPEVTGNEKIAVMRHNFHESTIEETNEIKKDIEIAIHNISGFNIATAIFEVDLFDAEGKFVTALKHTVLDIMVDVSRVLVIPLDLYLTDTVRSYDIKLTKTITSELEKVQLRRNEVNILPDGSEELSGFVKNVSNENADAVMVVNYLDANDETIGVRTLELKDIKPGDVQKFVIKFQAPEGLRVRKRDIDIGELTQAEEIIAV